MFHLLANLFRPAVPRGIAKSQPILEPTPVPGTATSAEAFARLNEVAPLITAHDAPAPNGKVLPFVCREAILNRNERIGGYEFLLDRPMQVRFKDRDAGIRKTYDHLLMRELTRFGQGSLLRDRLAMIEIGLASLAGGIPHELPRTNTVIFLNAPDDLIRDQTMMTKRIDALVAAGFQVGWIWQKAAEPSMDALARCRFVRIDTPAFDGIELKELARRLARLNGAKGEPRIQIIARNVQTVDDFQMCFRAGFDFFQGPFISSFKSWKNPKSDVDRLRVFGLLKRLRSGADQATLASDLRTEPVLTYRLLRYINSAELGLQRHIGRIDEALFVIGADKLYRWLSLLLFDIKDRGFAERAMIERVLTRARTMELLSKDPMDPDLAFLTGLLSMLDQFVGRPIAEILPEINVQEGVKEALLTQSGPYAPLLDLAKVCEQGDPAHIFAAADRCGVDQSILNTTLMAALNWAHETAAITE